MILYELTSGVTVHQTTCGFVGLLKWPFKTPNSQSTSRENRNNVTRSASQQANKSTSQQARSPVALAGRSAAHTGSGPAPPAWAFEPLPSCLWKVCTPSKWNVGDSEHLLPLWEPLPVITSEDFLSPRANSYATMSSPVHLSLLYSPVCTKCWEQVCFVVWAAVDCQISKSWTQGVILSNGSLFVPPIFLFSSKEE